MGVASRIGEVAKEKRIALKELSRRANIPYTTLYNAVKRDSKMELETVKKIAAALGVEWVELYPGDESDEFVQGWSLEENTTTEPLSYRERVDLASAYLGSFQYSAEMESDSKWPSDESNKWLKRKLPEIAKKFDVKESDLDDGLYWDYPEDEKYLGDIHEAVMSLPIRFRSLEKICRALVKMNAEGQAVAADRVQELTQIPKYQRLTETPPDAPGGADDKEPTEK